ncbi:hypothetical protein [Variovorax sp. tm]|uniref:hypothetical protein n=1 Tax=Variovorax atrisoli TaxID=3394203 RepID=UPI003A8080BB
MADPTVIQCESACTVTLQHEFNVPMLQISEQQGLVIGAAILGVWAVAWVFRQVISVINVPEATQESE